MKKFVQTVDFRLLTPSFYQFLKDFLRIEKVRQYGDQYVINTFIPPFPGPAFDRFMRANFKAGMMTPIQTADLALTNACVFNCWHCYNAGKSVSDLPAETLIRIVRELEEAGAIVLNFTGGEPCLRHDLVDICASLREDSVGILATTGYNFTWELAKRLRETNVYSICFSLDSASEREHDRMRGVHGAFRIALEGIQTAKKMGFFV